MPSTLPITTQQRTTVRLTTQQPTTAAPTTQQQITAVPTTQQQTTARQTTQQQTTAGPTTTGLPGKTREVYTSFIKLAPVHKRPMTYHYENTCHLHMWKYPYAMAT